MHSLYCVFRELSPQHANYIFGNKSIIPQTCQRYTFSISVQNSMGVLSTSSGIRLVFHGDTFIMLGMNSVACLTGVVNHISMQVVDRRGFPLCKPARGIYPCTVPDRLP